MTHTFVSLTNRKVARENIVEGHSTQSVHQARNGLHTHLEATVGPMSFAPLVARDRRGVGGRGICRDCYHILLNKQSRLLCYPFSLHMQSIIFTPFVKYAERLLCRADAA